MTGLTFLQRSQTAVLVLIGAGVLLTGCSGASSPGAGATPTGARSGSGPTTGGSGSPTSTTAQQLTTQILGSTDDTAPVASVEGNLVTQTGKQVLSPFTYVPQKSENDLGCVCSAVPGAIGDDAEPM